jgi:hypothetical protein
VHGQDGGALGDVRQRDRDLPVEAARPEQGRVEDLGPVGGREDHDARGRVEAVHLGQQLVERLLALVVGHHRAAAGPALADRVDLVDEDDGRGALAGLLEQVADPGRADADEQLHETGPGDREERHVRLARDRAGQQRLAGAGRADHQHAARHHGAGPAVPFRAAQEVHHLGDLRLGPLVAGHVGERGARLLLVEHLGPGPAHAERALEPAGRALGQAAEQPDEDQDRQPERDQVDQHLGAEALPRRG